MERKIYCDLHTHTEYSDGMYVKPELLVRMAVLNGIDVLAITDHDNHIAYFDAKNIADQSGVVLIPGAEITTQKYHLLALNFDPFNKELEEFLRYSRELQKQKCELRIKRLKEHGLPITLEQVSSRFPNSRIGKYNVFVAMVEDRNCREVVFNETSGLGFYQRFRYYFSRDGVVGDLEDFGVKIEEAIERVHEAGGVIGLAHGPKEVEDESELHRLYIAGINFLEIQPNGRNREYKAINYDLISVYARKMNLPLTYGSDYHGPTFNRNFLDRGENVVSKELEEMLNKGFVKI